MTVKTSPCDWGPIGTVCKIGKWPISQVKSAATGSLKEGINAVAKDLWSFASSVLRTVYSIMDSISRPEIIYSPEGPLGRVYPITIWIGLILTLILTWFQVGSAVIQGPKSLIFLIKGAAQWVMAWFCALVVLNTVNTGATVTAKGIIKETFSVDSWQGLSGDSTFMDSSIHGLEGVALACLSVLVVIPYAFVLLGEMLIRQSGMELLAATFPIIIAGLVNERTARWFWTGLRWMLALICMLPLIALSMAIGHSIAVGAIHGQTQAQLGQAVVSGTTNMLTLLWPLALFKLFAFVDPNTVSGASFRSGLAGFGGGSSGGEDTEDAKQQQEGSSDSGAGAVSSPSGDASGGDKSQGQSDGQSQDAGSSNLMSSLAAIGDSMKDVAGGNQAAEAADHGASSMDAVGAGHPGGGTTGGQDDEDQDQDDSSGDDAQQDGGSPESQQDPNGGGNDPGNDDVPETPSQAMDTNNNTLDSVTPSDPGSASGGQAQDGGPGPSGGGGSGDGGGGPAGGQGDPAGGAGAGAAGGSEAAIVA